MQSLHQGTTVDEPVLPPLVAQLTTKYHVPPRLLLVPEFSHEGTPGSDAAPPARGVPGAEQQEIRCEGWIRVALDGVVRAERELADERCGQVSTTASSPRCWIQALDRVRA